MNESWGMGIIRNWRGTRRHCVQARPPLSSNHEHNKEYFPPPRPCNKCGRMSQRKTSRPQETTHDIYRYPVNVATAPPLVCQGLCYNAIVERIYGGLNTTARKQKHSKGKEAEISPAFPPKSQLFTFLHFLVRPAFPIHPRHHSYRFYGPPIPQLSPPQ